MSVSRHHSRNRASQSPRNSRNPSVASVPYLPQVESLFFPDGAVSEQATELLQDLVHPRLHPEETSTDEEQGSINDDTDTERTARANLPWWKRPSPLWLLVALPFASVSTAATLAPRIEIYTILACSVHKPEYTMHLTLSKQLGLPYLEDASNLLVSKALSGSVASSLIPTNIASERNITHIYFADLPDASDGADGHDRSLDRCASDPEVQAAVAKLTAVITASMGILACLTTAWWGSFSDRHGRTRVMGISITGLLLTDFNFIFVSLFWRKLPGGYWFLVVGPVIEGCLGGLTAGMAAMHAYLSDTTDPGGRSRIFSLFLGLIFAGVALGPTLGGLLIRLTNNILSVFYASVIMHLIYGVFAWIIIPESLSRLQMVASRVRYRDETRLLKEAREGIAVGILIKIKRLFGFLSPLTMFMPVQVKGRNPLKTHKRDWNLTLVAAGHGLNVMIAGSVPYKLQYAAATFHWSSEILGYYLSMAGAAKAAFLMVILPLAIKLLKPKSPPVKLPQDADPSQAQSSPLAEHHHSPSFDLILARVSLFIEVITYALLGLAPTPFAFALFTLMGSLGGGFSPAVHSVALELYSRRGEKETGKLFGALSVLQALGSQIIGPTVFSFTYIKSVAVFPPAVFYLSAGIVSVSFVLMNFVRIPKETVEEVTSDAEEEIASAHPHAREEILINLESEHVEPEANNGRISKTIPADSSLVDV